MNRKKWNVRKINKERSISLARDAGIPAMAALILEARGYDTASQISDFFDTDVALSDPFEIKDMEKGALRVQKAIDNFEKICVYGDYDCDGLTATAMLYTYLELNGADVIYFVPSRLTDGYGLNANAVKTLKDNGVDLIITVDNGISAIEEAKLIKELGMDMVITDHHKPSDVLPECEAIIDPHREDDSSVFKEFAGVGVTFKFICALDYMLSGDMDPEMILDQYSDLIALGTVADLVPLVGENRLLVKRGLQMINEEPRPAFSVLARAAGLEGKITSERLSYYVAPRVNAAGRMGQVETALMLLLSDYEDEAMTFAEQLLKYNEERQKAEADICLEIAEQLKEKPELLHHRALVFSGKDWHTGVLGIVASRIVEKYGKPTIILSEQEDGIAHGSARSIEGFSIFDALSSCSDLFVHFGGHTLAAGLGLNVDDIEIFRHRINEYALSVPMVVNTLDIEVRLLPTNLTLDFVDLLSEFEPFGNSNPQPIFGLFNMTVKSVKAIGRGKHIRLDLMRDGRIVTAVKFNMTLQEFPFNVGETVDFAVKITENVYNGTRNVSVQIVDMRPSGQDEELLFDSLMKYQDVYNFDILPEHILSVCPDRAMISAVYMFIRDIKEFSHSAEILTLRLGFSPDKVGSVQISLDALCELGLIKKNSDTYEYIAINNKVNLTDSKILQKLRYKDI